MGLFDKTPNNEWKPTVLKPWENKKVERTTTNIQIGEEMMKPSPKQLGDRKNQGKLKWSLVDFPSFEPMVRVLEFGAAKYAAHNWKKGLKITEVIDSLMRHLTALNDGEDNDPESGLPHIGHIQCNAMFLAFMLKNRPDLDERHKVES